MNYRIDVYSTSSYFYLFFFCSCGIQSNNLDNPRVGDYFLTFVSNISLISLYHVKYMYLIPISFTYNDMNFVPCFLKSCVFTEAES